MQEFFDQAIDSSLLNWTVTEHYRCLNRTAYWQPQIGKLEKRVQQLFVQAKQASPSRLDLLAVFPELAFSYDYRCLVYYFLPAKEQFTWLANSILRLARREQKALLFCTVLKSFQKKRSRKQLRNLRYPLLVCEFFLQKTLDF